MAEVVDRELCLPARTDAGLRAGHDPGVGDDDVERPAGLEKAGGECSNARQLRQVQFVHLCVGKIVQRLLRCGAPSRGNDHLGSGVSEGAGGLQP